MMSGETSQGRMKPYCWTEWIQANVTCLFFMISNMTPNFLKQRDTQFRWTLVHALCSSDLPVNVCKSILAYLKQKCLISQVTAKDAEGDTPLSSAIRSRVKPEIIELLLQQVPSYTKFMLVTRNDKHETPLDRALDMREWKIVRMLLKRCIENSLLPELTGISQATMKSETLLHRAFQCGKVKYLRIFLEVCRECKVETQRVERALVMQTEGGCTPWYYLMNHTCQKTMEKTMEILRSFDVDINSLYIDSKTQKSSLLHEAVRRNRKEFIDLLLRSGANRNLKDARGLKPFDRKRKVDSGNLTDNDSTLKVVGSVKCAKKKKKRRNKRRKHRKNPRVVGTPMCVVNLSHTGMKKKRRKRCKSQRKEQVVGVAIPAGHDHDQNQEGSQQHIVVETPNTLEFGHAVEQHGAPEESSPRDGKETTAEEHVMLHPSFLTSPDSVSRPAIAGQRTLSSSSTQQRPLEETTLRQATCVMNGTAVIPSLDLLTVGNGINHVNPPCDHAPIGLPDHHYIIALLENYGPPGVT